MTPTEWLSRNRRAFLNSPVEILRLEVDPLEVP